MAQKDIQEIAQYMEAIDDDKLKYETACKEAAKEAEDAIAEEDEAYEDEVIDKKSLGFIDDADANEADNFYLEDEIDTFEEDVSDCMEVEQVEEADDGTMNMTIDIFNDDGFGKHFISELMKHVPGIDAEQQGTKKNGDLIVKVKGNIEDLKKAWAFYLGLASFDRVSANDQEQFFALVQDSNGDQFGEADYREAVAHCLDPIDVKASTANLVGKNSCALTLVQEEKAKRSAKKMLKALKENDMSNLTDKELDALDDIQTAIKNGEDAEELSHENRKILELMVNSMGYSLDDWLSFDEEKQLKIMNNFQERTKLSNSGFADVHRRIKPDGKVEYYRNQYIINNPETGDADVIAFNPYYTSDQSVYQHPSSANKKLKKIRAAEEQAEREKRAKEAMKSARGKETWALTEFAQMIQHLDDKQRKNLMKSMIKDVEAEASSSTEAGKEIALIKTMFGKKVQSYDLGKAWGTSHVGVQKAADNLLGNLYVVAREMTGIQNGLEALARISMGNKETQKKFMEKLNDFLNSQPLARGGTPIDPEREARKRSYRQKKALDELNKKEEQK